MKTPLAWRMIVHARGRTVVAVLGVAFAVLLMFMQLGFYGSVITSANLVYDGLHFDLAIVSREYVFLGRPRDFPRRRLYQAARLAEVREASPLYIGTAYWTNSENATRRTIFVIGTKIADDVFRVPAIQRVRPALLRYDTAAVDTVTRPVYGSQTAGRVVEINGRDIELVGQYDLGIGFFELGAITVSDQNFIRIFREASLDDVAIGLIRLHPGADPDLVAQRLRGSLPEDVDVLTRSELAAHEIHHWLTKTSTGMIFGSGVIVAFLVGLVILTQTLTAQILNNIRQYATLKAMGYSSLYLNRIVLEQAILLAFVGFLPGCAVSLGLYELVRHRAYLPIAMTSVRVIGVLVLTVGMSAVAGAFAVRKLGRADPVDLF